MQSSPPPPPSQSRMRADPLAVFDESCRYRRVLVCLVITIDKSLVSDLFDLPSGNIKFLSAFCKADRLSGLHKVIETVRLLIDDNCGGEDDRPFLESLLIVRDICLVLISPKLDVTSNTAKNLFGDEYADMIINIRNFRSCLAALVNDFMITSLVNQNQNVVGMMKSLVSYVVSRFSQMYPMSIRGRAILPNLKIFVKKNPPFPDDVGCMSPFEKHSENNIRLAILNGSVHPIGTECKQLTEFIWRSLVHDLYLNSLAVTPSSLLGGSLLSAECPLPIDSSSDDGKSCTLVSADDSGKLRCIEAPSSIFRSTSKSQTTTILTPGMQGSANVLSQRANSCEGAGPTGVTTMDGRAAKLPCIASTDKIEIEIPVSDPQDAM